LTEESLLSGRLAGAGAEAVGLISEARDGERACFGRWGLTDGLVNDEFRERWTPRGGMMS